MLEIFEFLDYKWGLAFLSALISIGNLIYYISSVISGKTKPHMYTWLIWGLVTVVAAATQIVSGGGAGAFFTFLVAFNCFVIAGLSYFKGEKDIGRSDKICLAGCIAAICLWPLVKTPLLSLLIVTGIDTAGFYPTLRKSFAKPHQENLISFSLYGLTYGLSILALSEYNFLTIFYPAVIVASAWSMAVFLIIRRYQLGHKVFV